GVTDYELMCRAAAAAVRSIEQRWPSARSLAIVCGAGNNAGDGLVLARLAQAAGLTVSVLLVAGERFKGAAAQAAADCRSAAIPFTAFEARGLANADVIVDALLGTGLARPVSDLFRAAVEAINAAGAPVLALDIPSGLDADLGWPSPVAVRATATLTFLGLKQGLFLGAAIDHCGELEFAGLELPVSLGAELPAPLRRLLFDDLRRALPRRPRSAHKGSCGRLLLVGGGPGMPGAIRLAAEAALRCGAGLVYVATHRDSAASVLSGRPEIICSSVGSGEDLDHLLRMVDGVVLGPGLGQSSWAKGLWRRVLETDLPLVVDADALNLLALENVERGNWILTPHPGEAARLLPGGTVEGVQSDRVAAARALAARYRAIAVLKGPHTLVATHGVDTLRVCDRGNPGMATGGTGDVLAGTLGSLLVQTGNLEQAAHAGVLLHALAGDEAAAEGERGTVAGDLLPHLRAWANPR
ncbi:MAG TPA: NAD(P)H-hydrate dehydratase, partial [Gammaproteobacteria bacterium]|nr:NAD(P)H-hydrate dehydratase [Gammaproteobacteria bacterium]